MEYLVGQHVVILIFPLFLLAVYRLMEFSSIHGYPVRLALSFKRPPAPPFLLDIFLFQWFVIIWHMNHWGGQYDYPSVLLVCVSCVGMCSFYPHCAWESDWFSSFEKLLCNTLTLFASLNQLGKVKVNISMILYDVS